jgi:membrane protease YdiL (CAAX protease family)
MATHSSAPIVAVTVVGGLTSLILAWVIAGIYSANPSIRRYLSLLLKPEGHWGYYLFALCFFPAFLAAGTVLTESMGRSVPYFTQPFTGSALAGVIILVFLKTFLFTGGVNEEVGWRGFMLPGLLKRYNPLLATLILWLCWILWHLPIKFGPLATHSPAMVFYEWGSLLPISILFTWLYVKTGGSILICALFHSSMNTASAYIPITMGSNILGAITVISIIVATRMWAKDFAMNIMQKIPGS